MPKDLKKAILYYFRFPETHPTTEEIYAYLSTRLGEIDKERFNTILENLEKKQLIKTVYDSENQKHYHIRTEQHFHFICRECGKLHDLVLGTSALDMIKDHAQAQINTYGTISGVNISFEGTCHGCQR